MSAKVKKSSYAYQKLSEDDEFYTADQPYLLNIKKSQSAASSKSKMTGNKASLSSKKGTTEEDFSSVELRTRSRGLGSKPFQSIFDEDFGQDGNSSLIERRIQEGETLQKISLQYAVTISDLKRVNGLMSDQDFYGLKMLKIPVMKYSHAEKTLLEESLVKESVHSHLNSVEQDAKSDSSDLLPLSDIENYPEKVAQSPVQATGSSSKSGLCRSSESLCSNEDTHNFKKILKNVDANLVKAKGAAEQLERREEHLRDEIFNVTNGQLDDMYHLPGYQRRVYTERNTKLYVAVIVIVLVILVPFVYLLFHHRDKFLNIREGT